MSHFTALPVPPAVTTYLQSFHAAIPGATHMHPADYHLTLKYLGNPQPDVLTRFLQTLRSQPTEPLPISLTKLHVFENPTLHILVALAEPTPALIHLHQQHEAAAVALGIAPHAFPTFLPHITLASYPPQTQPIPLTQLTQSFTATSFSLYQSSRPHGTGVGRYTPLQTHRL